MGIHRTEKNTNSADNRGNTQFISLSSPRYKIDQENFKIFIEIKE